MGIVLWLNVLFTISRDVAYVFMVGTMLSGHWLVSGNAGREDSENSNRVLPARFQRRVLLICIAALLITHLVHPWFLAASMSGSDFFAEDFAQIPMILSSTHQGSLWYIDSLALAALGMAIFVPLRFKPIVRWAVYVALALMAFAKAAAGHAGADGDFTVAEFAQILHILSTAVWAGAVIVSGLFAVPRLARVGDSSVCWDYGNRLSKTVTWALATILVTGIYTSNRELNASLSALWTSVWGKILLAKIVFVLIAILLGAAGRFGCLQRPANKQRVAWFARLLLMESTVMVVVLALSGLLGSTAPPMGSN